MCAVHEPGGGVDHGWHRLCPLGPMRTCQSPGAAPHRQEALARSLGTLRNVGHNLGAGAGGGWGTTGLRDSYVAAGSMLPFQHQDAGALLGSWLGDPGGSLPCMPQSCVLEDNGGECGRHVDRCKERPHSQRRTSPCTGAPMEAP